MNEPLVLMSHESSKGNPDESPPGRLRLNSKLAKSIGFTVRQNNGVVLAIDSADCFVLPSSQLDLGQYKNSDTLAITLEEHLPLDAEEMVVSIAKAKSKETLTIVSERAPLVAEIERLELQQHWIAAVSSVCLLAVQELAFDATVPSSFDCRWKSPGHGWDVVSVRNGSPVSWQWVDEADLLDVCGMDKRRDLKESDEGPHDDAVPLFVLGESSEFEKRLRDELGDTVQTRTDAMQIEYASRMAERIVRGSAAPWLNLAGKRLPTREPWAPIRMPMLVLLGLICTALIVFQATLLWQSSSLVAAATESDDEQIAAFRKLYPGQKIPTDVVGLLRSEQRRLQATEEEMQKEPPVYSALPVLTLFLNSLPRDAVFRIDNVRAQSNQIVSAGGATRTLEDFQSLVGALRRSGFEFQQPDLVNMADGIAVRLEKLTLKSKNEIDRNSTAGR